VILRGFDFSEVNKSFSILSLSRRARPARLLSYALLFLFAYNATVEAVHNHRKFFGPAPAATGTVLSDDGSTETRRSTTSIECLVCQFQQNLSSVELFTPQLVLAPSTSLPVSGVASVSIQSLSRSTGQGRAPPVNS
jgi:hypothetical protein